MKILMVVPYLPYPIVSGGQIRSYNLLKHLSSKHNITLLSFIRDESEKQHIPELEKFVDKVITVKRTSKAWHPRNIFMSGVTPYPFVVCLYLYPSVKQLIAEELKNNRYDLIHAETFYVLPNIPQTDVPILLVEQVIEYLVYQRYMEMLPKSRAFLKPLLGIDVAKIKNWERKYWRQAHGLATMSEEDRDFILELEPDLDIDVIANGVDLEYFTQTKKSPTKHPTVLFIGNFKWLPNRDAVSYLVKNIWPQIKQGQPDAQLWIVGRHPTADIKALADNPSIKVEEVEDIRTAYANADVLLAPIRNGRGTKYKILEAMATKTPIVGTNLAVEGVNIQHKTHAMVSDQADELAQFTLDILNHPKKAHHMAQQAFELVQDTYSWEYIAAELDRVYQKLHSIHE